MNNKIHILEKKIGINFKNKKLLIRSLTHKSFSSVDNNEKLEFLGDRVLGLIISKTLLEMFPKDKEGILDKKLASLVNKKKCYMISKYFDLENFVVTRYAKNKKTRAVKAGFKKFRPDPPNTSFPIITANVIPTAACQSGIVGGNIKTYNIPVTKNPSLTSWPLITQNKNSNPNPTP